MPPTAINELVAQFIEQAPQGIRLTMHITDDVVSLSHSTASGNHSLLRANAY
jgi:hypothetical protein